MTIRWKMIPVLAVTVLTVTAFVNRKTVTAAPQAAPPAKTKTRASVGSDSALSIPDTTLAINSATSGPATPLSQRVVHYEIDARYDAAKHTIDATETLTYHNLTG